MAIRFRAITISLVAVIMILGGVAATQLNQELLPPIEFPQTFILSITSGLDADQALDVVTLRVEEALREIPEIANVESTTSAGSAFIIAANDFGLDQDALRAEIRRVLDDIYFPTRTIAPAADEDATAFANRLLADLDADVLLYLEERDPNFLFQLTPAIWEQFSDETIEQLAAYLAQEVVETTSSKSALENLVDQEIVPQLEAIDLVVNVQIDGGQTLPGEEVPAALATVEEVTEENSLLLNLSSEVWVVISGRLDGVSDLNESAVSTLSEVEVVVPETAPDLPESWQMDNYKTATDLTEVATLTTSIADALNDFIETGTISAAIAQTDDLSPEIIEQMLEIEPTLVNAFESQHFAAMSQEVFDAIPQDLEFDGFTRDELAAAALARSLTGQVVTPEPVNLPSAWRLTRPQIISFSFADLPLATFSIFSTAAPQEVTETVAAETETSSDTDTETTEEASTDTIEQNTETVEYPEGPELPRLFALLGEFGGFELDTADDALTLQLPEDAAGLLGGNDAAALLNFLPQLSQFGDALTAAPAGGGEEDAAPAFDPAQLTQFLPALGECNIGLAQLGGLSGNINFDALAQGIIGCIDVEVFSYVIGQDSDFPNRLTPEVYQYLRPEILELDGVSYPLSGAWNTLSARPEFENMPLSNLDDLIALGDGSAAEALNAINETVPQRFAGYEVRLFDSLTPAQINYIATNESDFFETLDADVLLKLSATTLAELPEGALEAFSDDVVQEATAIASGEQPSAVSQLGAVSESEAIPARDDAPALNPDWKTLENFISGVEFNNAYDFFRFPNQLGTPSQFINGLFNSPGGAGFAGGLLGNMPYDAFYYIAEEDPSFINELVPRALNLLPQEIYDDLPQTARDRAEAGVVFVPDTSVTRTNGAPSLLVTIFKDSEANTVRAYAEVEEILNAIDEADDSIAVDVAFEQSSFIEDSVTGVVREGTLGAFFAIVNILIFLSGDVWARRGRTISGIATIIAFAAMFGIIFSLSSMSIEAMFEGETILFTVLAVLGMLAGLGIIIYPGRLPYPSWRSTLVIGVSIPLSILAALALMNWLPPFVNSLLGRYAGNAFIDLILRLAPEGLTLNIMTLSGLTVAVGRLVDDSIVVLENIFRQLQVDPEADKREVVIAATRDVSVPIFSATGIAVLVFLPLGLTGGLISEFFLPFGIAVTYTLLSSFLSAMTVVPVLAFLFISAENVPSEEETSMERVYVPILRWVLSSPITRWGAILIAIASLGVSGYLFSQRPATFLPAFGEEQLSVSVNMPEGTSIIDTNELVLEMENAVREIIPADDLQTMSVTIGGGGADFAALFTGGGGVSENVADITIALDNGSNIPIYGPQLEERAFEIFGEENVAVSAGSLSEGGFGGFEIVVSGPNQDVLEEYNQQVIDTLEELEGIEDVTSTLATQEETDEVGTTFIRVGGQPALSYTGVLLTEDTINFTTDALEALETIDFPEEVTVGQGFDSEQQSEGFASVGIAIGIAFIFILVILVVVFQSPVYGVVVIMSVVLAPVGAAVALTVTDRTLGISALIGLLMLLGLVVTNSIVLIDRVSTNRKSGMELHEALIEAGGRRVRPILMTALTTIIGLIPLSLGLSEGAIIAAELGTVVIGGVVSSTILTLLIVPAAYYLATPLHNAVVGIFNRGNTETTTKGKN